MAGRHKQLLLIGLAARTPDWRTIPMNETIVIVGFLLGIYRRRPAHTEWVCTLYVR